MLYLKEMDEGKYSKLCAVRAISDDCDGKLTYIQTYFSAASDLHSKQVKALVKLALNAIKRTPDEEEHQGIR